MTKEKILSAYENLAESYNRLIDHKPHNALYDRPNTLQLFPDVTGKSILDAACGPGKYAEILIKRGALVTGFDFSPRMIRYAKKRTRDQGRFFVHDLTKPLDMLEDETFDIVLCALAMHYVPDWTPTIREFQRVLKPRGRLVISIEHPFYEYLFFKSENYFEIEPVLCTWEGFGEPTEVHSFRRPLDQCVVPLTENGFYIDKLVEPKPLEEFRKHDPKHYEELNQFPAFMCIRAVKKY